MRIAIHYWATVAMLLGTGCQALAAPVVVTPGDQNTLERQQKALLEQAQQQRDDLQNTTDLPALPLSSSDAEDKTCHHISHIVFQGAEHLPGSVKDKLASSWQGRCLTLSRINNLVRDTTNAYLQRGYITSLAWLPEQDIADGTLTVAVSEGRVEGISLDGQDTLALRMVFPGLVGSVLNLRDIEQGMERLNRLPSQPVAIDIQPGRQPGTSSVVLRRTATRLPVSLSFGADNSGQKSTGTGQMNAGVVLDNPLRLADQWSLSASRDDGVHHDRRSRSLNGGVSVPYGYWLFSYQAAWNDFYQHIPIQAARYRYLALRGANINAGKDVTLLAGHNADLNYRALDGNYGHPFASSRTPELGSKIHAGGNLLVNSARDLGTQGGTLSANGNITLLAGQNLWLSNVAYSAIDAGNDNNKNDRHAVTTVRAGKNLTAAANNQLQTYGARLASGGNMTLTSGGDMRLEAVQNHTYREGGREFTETRTQQGTELNAGGLMTVISGGSILFQATKLVVKGVGANWKPPVAVTDWGSRIAIANQQLQNAQQRINQAQQDKSRAEQAKNGKSNELTTLQRDINTLKQRQAEVIRKSQEFTAKHGKLMEINDWGLWQQSAAIAAEGIGITHDLLEKEKRANVLPNEINAEQSALNDAQQRLAQATQDRDGAQSRLTTARNEAKSKGADEAKQKAQVDAHNQAEALRAGNMDIAAKGGWLYAQAMEESSHYEKTEKKRKWWGKKTEVKQTRHDVTNKVTEFTAAGNITLMSRDDSTYEASKIEAGKNARLVPLRPALYRVSRLKSTIRWMVWSPWLANHTGARPSMVRSLWSLPFLQHRS